MPALGSICPLSCQVDRCVSFVFARAFRRALFKQPQVKPANQLGVACHILHAEDSTMDGLQPCEPVCKVQGPSSATRVARIAHVSPVAVIRDRSGGLNPLQELRPFMLEASDGENQAGSDGNVMHCSGILPNTSLLPRTFCAAATASPCRCLTSFNRRMVHAGAGSLFSLLLFCCLVSVSRCTGVMT